MTSARKDVAEAIAQAITGFEQRCVALNPKLVQAKTVGSLQVARRSKCIAPIERKRLRETPGSLRSARGKRQHLLEAKRSVLGYISEKGTGDRLTPRHILVLSDYSLESDWWADVFIFAFDHATEDA